jgi:hypothetical protein
MLTPGASSWNSSAAASASGCTVEEPSMRIVPERSWLRTPRRAAPRGRRRRRGGLLLVVAAGGGAEGQGPGGEEGCE